MNFDEFRPGYIARDIYTGVHYEVIEPDKRGMAKVENVVTHDISKWNAYNNNRFERLKGQLEMFV